MEALRNGAKGEKLGLHQRQYAAAILGVLALQIPQQGEVIANGLPRADVLVAIQNHAPCADGGLKQTRRPPLPLKEDDDTLAW